MFQLGLKKTQVWLKIALLVLCCSICPKGGYPSADADPASVKENLDNDEDHELEFDQDQVEEEYEEALEEDRTLLTDSSEVENAPKAKKKCLTWFQICTSKCCYGLVCDKDVKRCIIDEDK